MLVVLKDVLRVVLMVRNSLALEELLNMIGDSSAKALTRRRQLDRLGDRHVDVLRDTN
jgi:hypothetical protein